MQIVLHRPPERGLPENFWGTLTGTYGDQPEVFINRAQELTGVRLLAASSAFMASGFIELKIAMAFLLAGTWASHSTVYY